MTIREMEEQSGLTRANIRFYEAEGLLCPSRQENGYRDYSQADLQILLKIRLLRSLRVPIETIKALEAGKLELADVLRNQLKDLQREEQELSHARAVCTRICDDGARFDTLDAAQYLAAQDALLQKPVPDADAIELVRAPWRRFFARDLDLILYGVIWTMVLGLCKVNIAARDAGYQLLDSVVTVLLMLAIEPFLLSRFGTTIGKWVFGLGVTDLDGGRLSYRAAFERLKLVIWRGCGLFLPIYRLVRLWKSYRACSAGENLEWDWEYDAVVTLRRGKTLRAVLGVTAILAAALGLTSLAIGYAELPRHRGDVSVAEFCENYNQLAHFYRLDNGYELNAQGEWVNAESDGLVISMYETPRPEFVFSEQNGHMTGLSFAVSQENGAPVQSCYNNEILLCVLAFTRAQPGGGLNSKEVKRGLQQMEDAGLTNFCLEICGVTVQREIQSSGYDTAASMHALLAQENAQTYYAISFSMQK